MIKELVDPETGEIVRVKVVQDKRKRNSNLLNPDENNSGKLSYLTTLVVLSDNFDYKPLNAKEKRGVEAATWFKDYKESSAGLALLDWNGAPDRVFYAIKSKLLFHNYVFATGAELSQATGLDKSQVSKAVAWLIKNDLCICVARGQFVVNPAIVWCGYDEQRTSATAKYYKRRNKLIDSERRKAKAAKAKEREVQKRRKSLKVVSLSGN